MKRLTTKEFITKAKSVHGNTYDYSKVDYIRAIDPVEIICRKHGSFMQLPYNHLKGNGCELCTRYEARRLGKDEFIKRAIKVHGNKFDYSEVEYVNTKTPVKIICPNHGIFAQKPEKHLAGHGCPECIKNKKDDKESFIRKARRVHGNLYDYSFVEYVDQKTKVCIIDPKYGVFWQSPCGHLNGEGNPRRRCSRYSKPQLEMIEKLKQKFGEDDVFQEYKSKKYPYNADAYIKSLDLYIELNAFWTHGGHWFDENNPDDVRLLELWKTKSSSIYKTAIKTWTVSDLKKRNVAADNGLNYLVFWETDLSDFYEWYNKLDC